MERNAPDVAPRPERRLWDRARDAVQTDPALTAIVVVAFALRLGWVLAVRTSAPTHWMLSGDQYSYYYYGREIAEGHGYVSYMTGGPTPAYLIGRRLFGRLGGLFAAAILAVFPNLVYQVASLQLETMFIFWCLAALAIVVVHDWSRGLPSTRRLMAFGLVLGVSVLVRPFSIWFIAALFVAALVARAGWVRSCRLAAIPLAVVALMSVPWTIRNAIRMDAFVPTSTNTGDTLCLDRSMDATGGFRFATHDGCADRYLPEVERNRANTRMAIEFVIDHPSRELLQIGRRAKLIFGSDNDGVLAVNTLGGGPVMSDDTSAVLEDIADVAFHVVTVLAGAGLVVAVASRRRYRPEVAIVLLSMVALIAVPLLLWGNPRFHLPFSPFLAILAGGAMATSVEMLRRRRPPAGAGPGGGGGGARQRT